MEVNYINLLALLVLNEAHKLWLQLFKHSLLAKIICTFFYILSPYKFKMAPGNLGKILVFPSFVFNKSGFQVLNVLT